MVDTLSIQEMVTKSEKQIKDIKRTLDAGYYDYTEANLFQVEGDRTAVPEADKQELMESLRKIPLREFLAKSGTTGIAGAAYLIPDKIHTTLFDASYQRDIVDQISLAVINDIPGASLKVDIGVDGSYKAWDLSSGGKFPDEEIATVQATLTPTTFGIPIRVSNDMIEDANWDMVEWHLRTAGYEMGDKASHMALVVLNAGTDGDGTINTTTSPDDITLTASINSCVKLICTDEWDPDTMIITPEAWLHAVATPSASYDGLIKYASQYQDTNVQSPIVGGGGAGPRVKFLGLNTTFSSDSLLFTASSGYMTNCITIVFDKSQALLTGRKRWMRIEKYSDPVRDLVGAVVTSRQDSVTVYNDSIAKNTEA